MASQQPYYNASTSGSSPPVVQGTLAPNPNSNHNVNVYDHKHADHGVGAMEIGQSPAAAPAQEGNWIRGEVQPKRCNDGLFAFLFYAHLGVMASVAAVFAPKMISEIAEGASAAAGGNRERDLMEDGESSMGAKFASWMVQLMSSTISSVSTQLTNNEIQDRNLEEEDDFVMGTNDMNDMMILLGISALIAIVLSSGVLGFMIRHAEILIKFALLFNIASAAVFAVGSLFLSPFAAILGIGLFAFMVYYAYVVWGRIPFAACNLIAATTAVKANGGLAFFAYNSLFIMVGWSMWWVVSFTSVVYVTSGCDGQGNCEGETNGFILFALLLSYYWTGQVVKNVVHVTVAGTVGTWWFVPTEATSCCSHAVRDSFLRSVTTSFGSICMGSLLVAIVETAKNAVRNARESGDGGIFLCIIECLLACLQDILEYFNMWAFVFVGLYGYPYLEAGKNVINLFKTRGWTTIITDNLAQAVLTMVSIAVGLVTGLVAMAIAHGQGMVFGDELGASAAAFFAGFIIGMVISATLLTLVSSAVNTVIVCYAEAPREFEENHPKLSHDMQAAWKQAWPAEFQY